MGLQWHNYAAVGARVIPPKWGHFLDSKLPIVGSTAEPGATWIERDMGGYTWGLME